VRLRDRFHRRLAPGWVTAHDAGTKKGERDMNNKTQVKTVNQQVVLRDAPKGATVKTSVKAGLKLDGIKGE
jgi:hypothetical protein